MPINDSAASIYETLTQCVERLKLLHTTERISMTQDAFNTQWRDETSAYETAVHALGWAQAAVEWMITT